MQQSVGVDSYLVVEVGHVPSILLIVVVVSVGAVMRRRDALGVRCGSAVVKVYTAMTNL